MKYHNILSRVYLLAFLGILILLTASAAYAQVTPHFDCVEPIYNNGSLVSMRAYFGYTNTSANNVVIQTGPGNFLLPPSSQNNPTTTFLPGRHDKSFSALLTPPDNVTWFLTSSQTNFQASSNNGWASYCSSGTITYQGKLSADGAAAGGNFDLQFTLYDSLSGGTALGTIEQLAVPVTGRVFTVQLDVQKIFSQTIAARFLEITVRRTGETGPRVMLTPRQELTFAPFALNAKTAYDVRLPNSPYAPQAAQCDEANEVGKLFLSGSDKLYVCTAAGWRYATLLVP